MLCSAMLFLLFEVPDLFVAQGVDSTAASNEALDAGRSIARQYRCIVGISGAVDLVG